MTTLLTYTRLASRAVLVECLRHWFSQLVVGTRAVWKVSLVCGSSLCKSGQNLSVDWSDHVNGDGSIFFSIAQTELIENQLIARILKSVHTVVDTGMFSLMESNDINLIATVFSVTDGNGLYLNTAVFGKTDTEYPVIAHPALVLKRNFERNKKLQGDRSCELTNREM